MKNGYYSNSYTKVCALDPKRDIIVSSNIEGHNNESSKLIPLLKQYLKSKVKLLANNKLLQFGETIEYRVKDKKGNYHNMESKVNNRYAR